MKILIDANVLLDVALARPGLHEASGAALEKCTREDNEAYIAWHTISNVYYILRKQADHARAVSFIEDVLEWARVVEIGHEDAVRAIRYNMADLEDALQLSAAEACSAELILTRNVDDFKSTAIAVQTPEGLNR